MKWNNVKRKKLPHRKCSRKKKVYKSLCSSLLPPISRQDCRSVGRKKGCSPPPPFFSDDHLFLKGGKEGSESGLGTPSIKPPFPYFLLSLPTFFLLSPAQMFGHDVFQRRAEREVGRPINLGGRKLSVACFTNEGRRLFFRGGWTLVGPARPPLLISRSCAQPA